MQSLAFNLKQDSTKASAKPAPAIRALSTGSPSHKSLFLIGGLIVLFAFLQFFVPLRTAIKIGADEDWELSKATLALNGYHFYTDVWNDQPLLHTFIIKNVLKHVSPSVLGPRLVTSAFSITLLAGLFFICLRVSGVFVAAIATLLVIASPGFLELSSSCMVEIPALAPAVAGLAVLLRSKFKIQSSNFHTERITGEFAAETQRAQRKERLRSTLSIVVAGVLFGISFQIKFINIVLLPIAASILGLRMGAFKVETSKFRVEECKKMDHSSFIKSLLIFGGSLVLTFLAIMFAMGADGYWLQLKQSWAAHFASTKSFEYGSPNDHPFEWNTYLKNWDTTIPAIIGIIACLKHLRKDFMLIIPLAWFGFELVVFGFHKPWWSYYYIHNALPLCWCAAIGIAAVIERVRLRRRIPLFALTTIYGLLVAGWMSARVYLQISTIRSSPKIFSSLVIKEVERYKPFTKFIYTDEPAYSFHTGIPMPPSLAVVTLKRLWSGDVTNARLVEELQMSKPGVLLLKNQTAELPFSDWMQSEYRLVYQDGKHNLYARRDIVGKVKW